MKSFAQKHSVLFFLLLTFAWTWLFWFAAIPFREQPMLLTALVMIGGFGPALGGVLTLSVRSGARPAFSPARLIGTIIAAGVIFGLFVLRYRAGNIENYEMLAADLSLTAPTVAAALVASLVGGWALSAAVSRIPEVRARMGTILPVGIKPGMLLLGLLFYPALVLLSWGLAALTGMGLEYPGLWGQPLLDVLPVYALSFGLTALAQGGNEEPGWRGLLQPELQKRFSPLVAALIVSVFWSLWHLPLYLNGFYAQDLVGGMLGGFIFRIFLSIILAWFYNRSRGSLFLMIYLHTCFNLVVNFLPTSDLGLLVLLLIVVAAMIVSGKMARKLPAQA